MTISISSRCSRAAGSSLLVLLGTVATPAAAQVVPISPRVQSFAGAASDAITCGAEALAANPAALARACPGPTRMLLLPTLKVTLWSSAAAGLLWENMADFVDPGSLHEELAPGVRRELLEAVGPEGLRHRQRLDFPVAQFTGRKLSGSVTLTTSARGTVARDLLELALEGYEEGRLRYAVTNSRQDLESYITVAFGHGRRIGEYDVGVTAHAMVGLGLTSWQATTPSIDVAGGEITAGIAGMFAGERLLGGSLFEFGQPDGMGAGLDVGVQRDFGPYRLGLAVQNLVEWTSWSDDLFVGRYEVIATTDDVRTTYDTHPYRSDNATATEETVAARLLKDAHFPRRLRLGAGWGGARTSVGAGVVISGPGRMDRDWDNLVSIGAEYRPFRALRLQTGAATTFDDLHQLSAGAGLDLGGFHIDGAVTRLLGSDGAGGLTVGVGLSLSYQRGY